MRARQHEEWTARTTASAEAADRAAQGLVAVPPHDPEIARARTLAQIDVAEKRVREMLGAKAISKDAADRELARLARERVQARTAEWERSRATAGAAP